MSFHIPNHIQVVSKSAFFCVESTDPDQKTKQTEQGCTVLKSWSLQHCLKEQLAWGIQRCLQDGVHSSLASRGAHVCYVLPTFCPSPSSLGPETKKVLCHKKYLLFFALQQETLPEKPTVVSDLGFQGQIRTAEVPFCLPYIFLLQIEFCPLQNSVFLTNPIYLIWGSQ